MPAASEEAGYYCALAYGKTGVHENRRQPVQAKVEIDEVHEAHDPDQDCPECARFREEVTHREPAETRFIVSHEPRIRSERQTRIDALRDTTRASLFPLRASSRGDSGKDDHEHHTERQRRDAADPEDTQSIRRPGSGPQR